MAPTRLIAVPACRARPEAIGTDVDDIEAMTLAVAEGGAGRVTAPPNPWVGCVVVRGSTVVGIGHSGPSGRPHAETTALEAAGEQARGATVYVTLEPCSHVGVTPPCVDALIAAGVARVVVAVGDPDRRVSGRGLAALRAAGITVDVGVGEVAARRSLAAYLHQRASGRALAVVKSAISIDGRTSAADGSSQWITSAAARLDAHRLRSESQAVVIGAGTALHDRPSLTARLEPAVARQPIRVLLDARGRVPAEGPLADTALAPTLVLTTSAASPVFSKQWLAVGADVEEIGSGTDGIGVDLLRTLELLGGRDVLQALFEGGPTVHGALLRAGLIDRVVTYVGGVTLGAAAAPLFGGDAPAALADASRWTLVSATALHETDARLDWEPVR